MQMEYRRAGAAGNVHIGDRDTTNRAHRERLFLARLSGRGTSLGLGSGYASLWICLKGEIDVESDDGLCTVQARRFHFMPESTAQRGVARSAAEWLVLAVPQSLLGRIARTSGLRGVPEPLLFSSTVKLDRPLLAALVRLATLGESEAGSQDREQLRRSLGDLVHAAVHAQAGLARWVDRAYGRTEGHRRRVLSRLLKARNRIVNEPHGRHDIDSLALASRYSKSHFIRLFRDVFGVTPHDLLTIRRLEVAKSLIAETDLAISEVAATVGFESRFAFARLFRKRTGMSATEYRREAA